jgi:predicted ABC-class ATPase
MILLNKKILKLYNKSYGYFKDLKGQYKFDKYILCIDKVQSDPFAPPSRFRIKIAFDNLDYQMIDFIKTPIKKIASQDYLLRLFTKICLKASSRNGSGKSGIIKTTDISQEVFERTDVDILKNEIEFKFRVGLPAFGRRINVEFTKKILFEIIPNIVDEFLILNYKNLKEFEYFVKIIETQEYIRNKLSENNIVAFIADNSVLPRKSGNDNRPLKSENIIKFKSPESMKITIDTPYFGKISGLGIKKGVTLIVGGGYHGKSTLLNAIEKSVYNHIPGDGREFCATDYTAVKIRSEDGRNVPGLNISPFINNLPFDKNTEEFFSENASGSTSQAANIMEALEMKSSLLLIDEDTSATNFMIRDERMQELVHKKNEPITPFIDRVKKMYDEFNVSSIIVIGGSGDYFDVADEVIMMNCYVPNDVSEKAKLISQKSKQNRINEGNNKFGNMFERKILKNTFNPAYRNREINIKTQGLNKIIFGKEEIEMFFCEQLLSVSQTNAISEVLIYIYQNYDLEKYSFYEIISNVEKIILSGKFKKIVGNKYGEFAVPRRFEIACAINRLRNLKFKNVKEI